MRRFLCVVVLCFAISSPTIALEWEIEFSEELTRQYEIRDGNMLECALVGYYGHTKLPEVAEIFSKFWFGGFGGLVEPSGLAGPYESGDQEGLRTLGVLVDRRLVKPNYFGGMVEPNGFSFV